MSKTISPKDLRLDHVGKRVSVVGSDVIVIGRLDRFNHHHRWNELAFGAKGVLTDTTLTVGGVDLLAKSATTNIVVTFLDEKEA